MNDSQQQQGVEGEFDNPKQQQRQKGNDARRWSVGANHSKNKIIANDDEDYDLDDDDERGEGREGTGMPLTAHPEDANDDDYDYDDEGGDVGNILRGSGEDDESDSGSDDDDHDDDPDRNSDPGVQVETNDYPMGNMTYSSSRGGWE